MNREFRGLHLHDQYDSDSEDLLDSFYRPLIARSTLFKRAVGYFSDAALKACANELACFIEEGGKIYLVIGTFVSDFELSSLDAEDRSTEERLRVRSKLIATLKRLAASNDQSVAIIGDLVASGVAEIRVAVRDGGIYHEKFGIFGDSEGGRVAFIGSANETSAALDSQRNHESFSVFQSKDALIYERFGRPLEERFDRIWAGKAKQTRIYALDDEVIGLLKELAARVKQNTSSSEHSDGEALPALPSVSGLRPYQESALQSWRENKYRGILAMATGTGKTLTAIHALKNFREKVPAGFIIVVVPYQNLAIQWINAIREAGIDVLPAFQSYAAWFGQFQNACLAAGMSRVPGQCVVAVEDTFKSERFQELLNTLESSIEKNHLLIADECHHFNAPKHIEALPEFFRYRLGLSATPYDQFSEHYLDAYFGGIVFEFSLGMAIHDGYLCPYDYHVVEIVLNEEETEAYEQITKRIVQLIGSDEKITPENLFKVQPLLLQRARVVGTAADKLTRLGELVEKAGKLQYCLVYCGDGSIEDPESGIRARQVDEAVYLLHKQGWNVARITADESLQERESLIDALRDRSINAIVSIRVLDEGIDIPSCRTAFLLASQRSERQQIQRRGRVLRKASGKEKAEIFDFVVTGTQSSSLACRALVRRELERVWRFSDDAINGQKVKSEFEGLARQVGFLQGEINES